MNRIGRGALLCGLLLAACTHFRGYRAEPQPDGSYRLECRERLTRCLVAMEEVCAQGYGIVEAHEDLRYAGPREFNEPNITTVVIARCRTQEPVFGKTAPKTAAATPAPAAPAETQSPAAPARTCFPGATQACVGPGACKGGQQCLPDGAAFGPCDCGAPSPPVVPEGAPAAPR